MTMWTERRDSRGLAANVLGATVVVLAINAVVFAFGWEATSASAPRFVPPPVVIALVWTILFPCMAFARWELRRTDAPRPYEASLFVLFLLCATYPLYTGGLRSDLIGEAANVGLCLLTLALIARFRRVAPRAAVALVPLSLWLAFASVAGALTLVGD